MPRSSMHSTVMSNATSDRVCPLPDMFIESSLWSPEVRVSPRLRAHETACRDPRDAKRQKMTRAGPDRILISAHGELDGNPAFRLLRNLWSPRVGSSHDGGSQAHRSRGPGVDPAAAGRGRDLPAGPGTARYLRRPRTPLPAVRLGRATGRAGPVAGDARRRGERRDLAPHRGLLPRCDRPGGV